VRSKVSGFGVGIGAVLIAFASVASPALLAQSTQPPPPPTGDAKRGQELFDKTYKCYACHGYDGQTGTPRLVPMNRTQEAFVAYVRKPATPQMPKFVDPPEKDLVDVYAYIRSIPVAAPAPDSIPLLKGIIDRRSKGN
jgi:mono/diheme cytochrome c family protein